MVYVIIREIKGHYYRYQQESYRENGKVRTKTKYIGKATKKEFEEYKNERQPQM